MKIRFILAASALAVLAACGKAPEQGTAGEAAADSAPVAPKVPAGVYKLEPSHASLTWSIKHMGLSNYTARFARLDSTIVFDPANPEKSSVTLEIDPLSVRTDYPGDYSKSHAQSEYKSWDDDVALNPRFLDGRANPKVTFKSTSVEQNGPRTARVTGDLTFRGQTHPVTLDVTFNGELERHYLAGVPAIGFSAEGSFKPSQFGMPALAPALADEVKVRFEGEFLMEQPAGAAQPG